MAADGGLITGARKAYDSGRGGSLCAFFFVFSLLLLLFVRSYVKSPELRRDVVFAHAYHHNPYSRDSANTLSSSKVFFLDQSRSHLQSCEHSWAEQTTGL